MKEPDLTEAFKDDLIDFDNLTLEQLMSEEVYELLFNIKDEFERAAFEGKCTLQAKKHKAVREFNKNYKYYKIRAVQQLKNVGGRKTEVTGAPITLNCKDWIANDYGVIKNEISNQSGNLTVRTACPHPILPTEILWNMDTGTEKVKLTYYKNGEWDYVVCDRATTASNTKIVDLANRGIEVNSESAKYLVSYIADCVALNEGIIPRNKACSRMGWADGYFMPYDENIRFDGEKENRYLYECIAQKGDYGAWVDYTKELRKNKLLRLQMAASFASPLIEKVSALPFVLHLWGGPLQSGSGKTVGMMVAASIWGNPRMGCLVRTMDSTQNATMNIAGFLHSIPYFGDELQLIKDKWGNYDKLIMKVCEGADRGRMSYDKMLPTKTWRNTFIFTGEEAIVKRDSGAGVYSRTIEVECTEMVIENGNTVVNFINDNFGYAGKAFVEAIKDEALPELYSRTFKKILSECQTNEKQAMAMALILVADFLAEKHIYHTDQHLRIEDVKEYLFKPDDIDVANRAYEWALDWISENRIRFNLDSSVNKGEIWGQIEEKESIIWINRKTLTEHMSKMGIELTAVIRKWADKGLIKKDSYGKNTHYKSISKVAARYVGLISDKTAEIALVGDDPDETQEELPFCT